MSFSQPLWLLLLVPLLAIGLRSGSRGLVFPCAHLARGVPASPRRTSLRLLPWLEVLAFAFVIGALAGPRAKGAVHTEVVPGVDIQLVLDTSSSMQWKDGSSTSTRLESCLRVLAKFVERRAGDRLGLVTFALYPRVVAPLTSDHDLVLARLREVHTVRSSSPEDNTAIGIALAAAAMQLEALPTASKVLVLLTDGEQRVDDVSLSDAADFLRARDIRLYAVAAGRTHRGFATELEQIAERTGGRGYLARDEQALERIYAEIDALEKSERTERTLTLASERHASFLLAAAALLMLEIVLGGVLLRGRP